MEESWSTQLSPFPNLIKKGGSTQCLSRLVHREQELNTNNHFKFFFNTGPFPAGHSALFILLKHHRQAFISAPHLRYKRPESERPGLCQRCETFILFSDENLRSQSQMIKLLPAAILNSTIKLATLRMVQHPSEMANDPLRNVDTLINKELCHRRADSFINKVHTTLIMQTIAVSSAKLTPLHSAAGIACINHCCTNDEALASSFPLLTDVFEVYSSVICCLFNWSVTLVENATADCSQQLLNMSAVTNRHGSFQHFTNNFRKNHLWFTSSTADRGKELLEANMSADGKSLRSSFLLIRVLRPPSSTHNPFLFSK